MGPGPRCSHPIAVPFYLVKDDQRAWRFSKLEDTLGISPNTLSSRLEEPAEAGLLERHSYDEVPPRVEYEATQRPLDLAPIFEQLREWAKNTARQRDWSHPRNDSPLAAGSARLKTGSLRI